jgi:hypothetical protein
MAEDPDQRPPTEDGSDAPDADEGHDADQWRFALDEVGEDAEPRRPPLEPESPSLENALFVVLGVVGTVLLLVGAL